MTRLLLVDDEALVRDGLRAILAAEPDLDIVGEASDGAEAVSAVGQLHPDLVLMDLRMPHVDGVEACRRIVARHPTVRVLMLTTFGHDDYLFAAMRVGAAGFLLKDIRRSQLVQAIHAAVAGDTVLAPAIVRRLVDTYAATPPPKPPPALQTLTSREREVLELVARGLSNSEIAHQLSVSESTAKTHLVRTLTKLGVRDRVHAVIFAYEHGLVRPRG